MKTYNRVIELIKKGMSTDTLSKLSESQIKVLHEKLNLTEQNTGNIGSVTINTKTNPLDQTKIKDMTRNGINVRLETELDEDMSDDEFGNLVLQKYSGQQGTHDEKDMAPDGMDDDSENDRTEMGEEKSNPWAICTSQLGKEFGTKNRSQWSAKEKNKYERCVKDVKKSLKEGKNPVSLFLESQIEKLVENNLPPKITKGDLLKYLKESSKSSPSREKEGSPVITPDRTKTNPNSPVRHPGKKPFEGPNPDPKAKKKPMDEAPMTSPSREKEGSPVIAPDRPKTRPNSPVRHPGKKPFEGPNPDPKAKRIDPEQAKNEVIKTIMNILKK
jgi:hypothetical protein